MSQQIGSKSIHLTQPGAGQTVNVPVDSENMRLSLGFTPDPNAVAKTGQNLEFTFKDGGKIVLDGYYDHFANKTLPVMITEGGDELPGTDFLASLNEDLLTAAGVGAGAVGSGSGEYADDPGALIDGINRLGSLGTIYWDRATEVSEIQHQMIEVPGDTLTGAFTIVVDAGANAPTDIEVIHPIYADGTSAVGGNASVTFSVSAKFADTDGSEDHYILVEQQPGWTLGSLPSGYADAGIHTDPDTGKTYFKIQVIDSTEGHVNVAITLKTPPADELHDGKVELIVGGMAVETSNGDHDCNFGSEPVAIMIGVVDSSLKPVSDSALLADSGGEVILAFGLAEGEHNDELVSITITLPAQGGQIFCNGTPLSQSGGQVIFDYDPTVVYSFKPAEDATGEMTLTYSALVKDKASGAEDTLTGSSKVIVGNHAPVPVESTMLFDASSGLFSPVLNGSVQFSDSDPGDTVTVHRVVVGGQSYSFENYSDTLSVAGAHGTLLIHKDGSYSYELAEGSHSNEQEQFQIVGIDKYGAESLHEEGSANLTITIGNVIVGSDGHDVIHAGHEDSVIYGCAGNDTIYGGAGHDIIYGGDGDDVIHAGLGGSVIHGGDGNDLLIAGPGDDIFFGGAGADTFQWNKDGLGGTDTIKDFNIAEGDKIDLHGLFSDPNKSLEDLFRSFQSGNADNDRLEVKVLGADVLELAVHSDGNPSQTIIVHGVDDNGTTLGQAYDSAASDADKLALLQYILIITS